MTVIQNSVGQNGINRQSDVVEIQKLLNRFIVPGHLVGAPLVTDGIAGNLTKGAIGQFQRTYAGFQYPDKRVDPAGKTFVALNGPVSPPKAKIVLSEEAKSVIRVLRGSAISSVHFSMGTTTVQPGHFRRVADAIESGRISVVWMDALGNNAEYHHSNVGGQMGMFVIGFKHPRTWLQRSVIVHEATHAIGDYWGKPMTVQFGEALAHLAQGMYYFHQTGKYVTGVHPKSAAVLKICVDIAKRLKKSKTLDVALGEVFSLGSELLQLPTVKPNTAFFYDGI